jgi:hypothetical protein
MDIFPSIAKQLNQVKNVLDGLAEEIIAKNRMIARLPRVLTDHILQGIHQYLESN